MQEKTYFWRKGKLELPLPCANSYEQSQLQPKSLYCSQSWKNSITYAKYMWKMCVHIAMRYLCSIHIIDAYSSTTTRKMQVHQCIYEGPLQHLGGGPANIHLQGLPKTQTGSTIYINHFFHLFSAAAMLQHLSDVSEPTWDTAGNAGKAEVWDRFDTAFQH